MEETPFDRFISFFNEKVLPEWKTGFQKLNQNLSTLKDEIDIFDEKLYLDKTSYIRDPLWGEIILNRFELDLLDSFFLQRLRTITQMGGTKFVYPSANHKRFDHSLGTFGVISYILNEKILKRRDIKYNEKFDAILKGYATDTKQIDNLSKLGIKYPSALLSAEPEANMKKERIRNWRLFFLTNDFSV